MLGQKLAEQNKKNQSKALPQNGKSNGKITNGAKNDSSQQAAKKQGAADNLSETSLGHGAEDDDDEDMEDIGDLEDDDEDEADADKGEVEMISKKDTQIANE